MRSLQRKHRLILSNEYHTFRMWDVLTRTRESIEVTPVYITLLTDAKRLFKFKFWEIFKSNFIYYSIFYYYISLLHVYFISYFISRLVQVLIWQEISAIRWIKFIIILYDTTLFLLYVRMFLCRVKVWKNILFYTSPSVTNVFAVKVQVILSSRAVCGVNRWRN